ncbi:MAG: sigma-54 factor interaction domain-containing protein, partial [Deltaproteobacteria bacterium]|nr:sigma-54 factor interaction domain-containing protein [Deltaproteobacteria bacterium]
MNKILTAWIGFTDIRASKGIEKDGLGPIGQAVEAREFDEIDLVSNLSSDETNHYVKWLEPHAKSNIILHIVKLTGPTQFGEIYEAASRVVSDIQARHGKDAPLTFHLSPGTPAMAAVWIILSKTRFPAELIESSPQEGVKTASVPLDISAELIPDLLRRQDDRLERLAEGLPPKAPEFSNLIHRSNDMKRVILKAQRVAPRSVPVLIEGESGTGKELLARAIHEASPRRDKPFVAVNCGAIPNELIESELFGYEKGAFTGAEKQKKGYFEAANEGTLFLDEIGELPVTAQVKLLRALQE